MAADLYSFPFNVSHYCIFLKFFSISPSYFEIFNLFLYLWLFFLLICLCMYAHVCSVHRVQKRAVVLWNWSYRWLLGLMWVLSTKPWPSARTTGRFNLKVISPAALAIFLTYSHRCYSFWQSQPCEQDKKNSEKNETMVFLDHFLCGLSVDIITLLLLKPCILIL